MRFWSSLRSFLSVTIVSTGLMLVGCGTAPKAPVVAASAGVIPTVGKPAPILPKAGSGRGGYYKDDGPGDNPPDGLELTLDAEPKVEPYSLTGNKPYVVFGKTYSPLVDDQPFSERGTGSWYGKKFQGQRTSSGEPYDMYKMTAAHPTLPIPSYARITNMKNGKQVIVKINDRGPFHTNRIVDLSYTAALKLDYLGKGSGELLLERLLPEDIEKMAENKAANRTKTIVASASTKVSSAKPTSRSAGKLLAKQVVATDTPVDAKAVVAEPAAPVSGGSVATYAVNSVPVLPVVALADSAAMNTASGGMSGFYLQFGAYGLRSNAEAIYKHLTTTLLEKIQGQLPPVEIVQQGTLYRLFSGPFTSRAEAMAALQMTSGVVKALIVQR